MQKIAEFHILNVMTDFNLKLSIVRHAK